MVHHEYSKQILEIRNVVLQILPYFLCGSWFLLINVSLRSTYYTQTTRKPFHEWPLTKITLSLVITYRQITIASSAVGLSLVGNRNLYFTPRSFAFVFFMEPQGMRNPSENEVRCQMLSSNFQEDDAPFKNFCCRCH